MSDGLTQDDFRRLMATPRRPAEGEEDKFKAPAPKAPKGGAIFAQPRAMRKKNFFKKPAQKKDNDNDEEEEEEQEKSNYRDRAAERRKQEQEGILDESQLTTEELLQRTQPEVGEELDAKQLYEQSKFLGGDIDHTHLVKGLDFALLNKVRTDLQKEQQEQSEEEQEQDMEQDDFDQVFDQFERGEIVQDQEEVQETFHSTMAKNIHELIQQQNNVELQPRIELFEPGRMAFVFELADEVGNYSDAFAIPTAMIRSKVDVDAKLSKLGWSEDVQAETNLVIERISRVMTSIRRGERSQPTNQVKKAAPVVVTSEPVAIVEDGFMGDIFEDAGRDYQLDETSLSTNQIGKQKGSYFTNMDDDEADVEMETVNEEEVKSLLSKATSGKEQEESEPKRRKYNAEVDTDAADIDMFGLSTGALPTSFGEHETTAYQSDDEEQSSTQMIDQGTNRNKKAQLTRWDFETEEEWQNYKDSIEIHPKSAFQFGVKISDGRKRNRERKGMSDKQKLDRDYQQVKNIMTKKYGKSLNK